MKKATTTTTPETTAPQPGKSETAPGQVKKVEEPKVKKPR